MRRSKSIAASALWLERPLNVGGDTRASRRHHCALAAMNERHFSRTDTTPTLQTPTPGKLQLQFQTVRIDPGQTADHAGVSGAHCDGAPAGLTSGIES
ncbi:MAG TPA: hypothetical protein VII80_01355 [Pseudolabrys sp.]|jgi:hypothetical protein